MTAPPPPSHGLAVTVLGSGGPFLQAGRVSSGYLLWADGEPRLLVDAGGGVFERLARLGTDPAQFDAVLLTHTHIDHSGGLAPVVFAAFMQGRHSPLPVSGPSGRDGQPGRRVASRYDGGIDFATDLQTVTVG